MDQRQLRLISGFVRRRWWIVIQAVLVVGLVAGWLAYRKPERPYQATATVQVAPNQSDSPYVTNNTPIFLATQVKLVNSPQVNIAATKNLPGVESPEVARSLSVGTDPALGYVLITAKNANADRATAIANAVANAYIDERETQQFGTLKSDSAAVDKQVNDLQITLADAQEQIGTTSAQVDALKHDRDLIVAPITPEKQQQLNALNAELTAAQVKLGVLQTQYDTTSARYNSLLIQQQALHDKALIKPSIDFTSPAGDAIRPEQPSPVKRGLLGALIGLLVGLGLALLLELVDDRIRAREDLDGVTPVPVIGQISFAKELTKRKAAGLLPVAERPTSPFTESIRALRTSLTFLSADRPIHCISVTSAEPDDGKSVVAANLAASYAMSGISTILVAGDFRRPSLDRVFARGHGQTGLSELIAQPSVTPPGSWAPPLSDDSSPAPLASGLRVEDVLLPTRVMHLRFMSTGAIPPNPAELLASRQAQEVFKHIRANTEMVVIDSPPTAVADGALLASMADAVVVVARMNRTHKSNLTAALKTLLSGNLRVAGIVLNRVRRQEGVGYGYTYASPVPMVKPKKRRRR